MRAQFSQSLRPYAVVFANPDLRRLQLALAGSVVGQWAYGVALGIFAYRAAGAAAVGTVYLARMLTSGLAAPFTALLGDRYPRREVMLLSDLIRAATIGAAAAGIFLGAPFLVIVALAIVAAVVSTAFRPAQAALLPAVARTPAELTAANAVFSTIQSFGMVAGPAVGGLLLATSDTSLVFALNAGTFLWSAGLIAGVKSDVRPSHDAVAVRRKVLRQLTAGLRTIGGEPRLRLLLGLIAAQTFVNGALNVLIVVTALELLDVGTPGVGLLLSALGVGGMLGGLPAMAVVGRHAGIGLGIGIVGFGIPLAMIAAWPNWQLAVVLIAVMGAFNTVADVGALTLLQRGVADEVLARVFGAIEGIALAAMALGAGLAPVLLGLFGVRGSLLATALFLVVAGAISWQRLTGINADESEVRRQAALLRSVPMFKALPAASLQQLALVVRPLRFLTGATIVVEGEPGDLFYVIEEGEVEVDVAGASRGSLGPGDSFGEIALLRDVPRTATLTARTEVLVHALGRDEFLASVTSDPASAEAAESVVAVRLGEMRAGAA